MTFFFDLTHLMLKPIAYDNGFTDKLAQQYNGNKYRNKPNK